VNCHIECVSKWSPVLRYEEEEDDQPVLEVFVFQEGLLFLKGKKNSFGLRKGVSH
jgi:hypothetical protein